MKTSLPGTMLNFSCSLVEICNDFVFQHFQDVVMTLIICASFIVKYVTCYVCYIYIGGSRISRTEGGGNSWIWGKTPDLLFGKILAENGMKMKEIEPTGHVPSASLDPPMFYIGGCPVNIKK